MNWTKTRDKLPGCNGYFLIFDGGEIDIAWFQCQDMNSLKPRAFYDEFNQQLDVTHWMPMPSPPTVLNRVKEIAFEQS